jgi:hypothetical protein
VGGYVAGALHVDHVNERAPRFAVRRLVLPARLPGGQRANDASLRARLRAALDDNQRQREEIARLREELELAHGRERELELDRRVRRG